MTLSTKPDKNYRPDIDGLRAIAVTSVVLYHAGLPGIQSGFMGVDIFFVISGFLIGGIIYRDILASEFSFANFYARRARRILPALFAVILFVCIFGFAFLTASELKRAAAQSLSALMGVSNMLFWQDTDYFRPDSEMHPLLMTWSLGVEEQFYLGFPFLLILVSRFRRRYHLLTLALVCMASLAVSIALSYRYQPHAFYLLPPRAWEMGAGALLAMAQISKPAFAKGRSSSSNTLAVFGLVLISVSLTLIGKDWVFPGLIVLAPILGTVILLHTSASSINRAIGNRPMQFIGLISYSWYLWHWPLMAFVRNASDLPPSLSVMLSIAVLSFLVAVGSWRFIEQPFRWANGTSSQTLKRYALALLAVLTIPTTLFLSQGLPDRQPARVADIESVTEELHNRKCLQPYFEDQLSTDPVCMPEDASIALVGDSHAAALAAGLVEAAHQRGTSVAQLTKASCEPFSDHSLKVPEEPNFPALCYSFNERAIEAINSNTKIKTVILAGAWPEVTDKRYYEFNGNGIGRSATAVEAISRGLTTTANRLHAHGKKVIIVGDVPRWRFDATRHLITDAIPFRAAVRSAIDGNIGATDGRVSRSTLVTRFFPSDAAVKNAAHQSRSSYFGIKDQLCDRLSCIIEKNGKSMFVDITHLSIYGSKTIDWAALD